MEQNTQVRRGTDESGAWFKGKLVELGVSQADLARTLRHYGDDRPFDTILRGLRRMAAGDARVNGEMRAWLLHAATIQADNRRQAKSLDRRIAFMREGRMHTATDGVDTTAEVLAEVERRRQVLRDSPVPFRA